MPVQMIDWQEKARTAFAQLFDKALVAEEGDVIAEIPANNRKVIRIERKQVIKPERSDKRGWLHREIRRSFK
jgi:hypothetical protein